jgi:alginate O-acetyltransferase complex protein AlgI
MPFNSLAYALLLSASFAWCRLLPAYAAGLVLASLVFFLAAGPFDTAVFLAAVALNWLIQIALPKEHPRPRIFAAALLNIGLIAYFKYKGLLLGQAGQSGSYLDTALPLGVSFYSLQALAYHVDVARGRHAPARSFAEFFLFKAFFPQVIAGPIVRAHQLLPQVQRLFAGRRRRHRLLIFGLSLIALGLVKKVVLADSIAPFVDEIFAAPPGTTAVAWLGAVLFAFQIYFDFSGYSDIAIGSAYLLGIRLPWNFRTPYLSTSPREFWQRWHITLSTWIRDYLYIPLGGSRGTPVEASLVLLTTMAVAGLWHGANYTFIVWGACWGLYILTARLMHLESVPGMLWWPAHMLIVVVLWVLFRSPSLGYATHYLATMFAFTGSPSGHLDGSAPAWQVALGVAGLFALHWGEARLQRRPVVGIMRRLEGPVSRGILVGTAVLLVLLPVSHSNPFIYFRF